MAQVLHQLKLLTSVATVASEHNREFLVTSRTIILSISDSCLSRVATNRTELQQYNILNNIAMNSSFKTVVSTFASIRYAAS